MTLLAEDLLWLLLDDDTGRPVVDRIDIPPVLAGAVLTELALTAGATDQPLLTIDGRGRVKAVDSVHSSGLRDRMFDAVLTSGLDVLRRKPLAPHQAIQRMERGLERVLLDRLRARNRTVSTRVSEFGIPGVRRWPTIDHAAKREIRDSIRPGVLDSLPLAPRSAALVGLLTIAGALPHQFPGWARSDIRAGAGRAADPRHGWATTAVMTAMCSTRATAVAEHRIV
ncbi:GOLPH3/VPS74 family protein [Nocardia sp. NPDC003963]